MVSIPDFDLNKREDISDKKFINRSTKGVYELGSVFKTFTLAAGLQQNVIQEDTLFKNLPKKIKCAGRSISEYDMDIPSNLTAEEILIRSGNIGSVKIAQKIGLEKFKESKLESYNSENHLHNLVKANNIEHADFNKTFNNEVIYPKNYVLNNNIIDK